MRAVRRRHLPSLAAAALVGVALGAAAGPGVAGAAPTSAAAAQGWYQSVVAELTPLQSTLVAGLQAVTDWQDGMETATQAGREIERDLPELVAARNGLAHLAPLAGFPYAKDDDVDALGLYVEAFELAQVGHPAPTGALVGQLQRSFAAACGSSGTSPSTRAPPQLAALLGTATAGIDVQAASQLPDWSAQRVAPGEPLISRWVGTTRSPRRPRTPSGWAATIRRSNAPAQASVRTRTGAHHPGSAGPGPPGRPVGPGRGQPQHGAGTGGPPTGLGPVAPGLAGGRRSTPGRGGQRPAPVRAVRALATVAGELASIGTSLRTESDA